MLKEDRELLIDLTEELLRRLKDGRVHADDGVFYAQHQRDVDGKIFRVTAYTFKEE